MQKILAKTEVWILPVFNPDGYDYTFTCGQGDAVRQCGPGEASSNRLWRKTLRDNNANGIYGDSADGVDANRNFPEQWALDEEGSSANPLQRRLPRPVRQLRARELLLRPPAAAHQAGRQPQLPLGRAAAQQLLRLHHQPPGRRQHARALAERHRRRRGCRPVPARPGLRPLRHARRDRRLGLLPVRHDRLHARARHGADRRLERQLVRLPRRRGQGQRGLREEPAAGAEHGVVGGERRLRPPVELLRRRQPLPGQGHARHRADGLRRLLRRRSARRGGRAPRARPDRLPGLGLRPRRPQPDAVPAR